MQLKELENRVYCGKECVQFDYTVKGEQPEDKQTITFHRTIIDGEVTDEWYVRLILTRTEYLDTQVYNAFIRMPKSGMPLTVICESGLRAIRMILVEEIQRKSLLEFAIGESIRANSGEGSVM